MKKFGLLFLVLIIISIPVLSYAGFSDVPTGHWAEGYITELTGKGVINGFPDGTFGPDKTLTAGQFMKLIVIASMGELDNAGEYTTMHWASEYLNVLENYQAVEKGVYTNEKLDEPISRIDVVKILSICDIEMRDHDQQSATQMGFYDISQLSNKEKTLLSHAVASGIIGGYPDETFRPNNNLTRAEAAKILSVYMSIK